ncbi:MAG: hypothetical protein ABIJ97_05500 [Bacteroidota bacterium]
MAEQEINNQIQEVNSKLDLLLQYVDQQRLKTQEIEDLVKDFSIVGNDIFKATVDELDNKNVELDTEEFKMLIIRLIKNVGNINMAVGMFESLNDFLKDMGPVVREISFDLIAKIEEFEKKGYFSIIKNLTANLDKMLNVLVQLSQPEIIDSFSKMINVATTLKMDDKLDNKSLFGLYRELKKPEVRKTISYSLRLVQELHKEIRN